MFCAYALSVLFTIWVAPENRLAKFALRGSSVLTQDSRGPQMVGVIQADQDAFRFTCINRLSGPHPEPQWIGPARSTKRLFHPGSLGERCRHACVRHVRARRPPGFGALSAAWQKTVRARASRPWSYLPGGYRPRAPMPWSGGVVRTSFFMYRRAMTRSSAYTRSASRSSPGRRCSRSQQFGDFCRTMHEHTAHFPTQKNTTLVAASAARFRLYQRKGPRRSERSPA